MLQQSRKHMKGGLGGARKAIADHDGNKNNWTQKCHVT